MIRIKLATLIFLSIFFIILISGCGRSLPESPEYKSSLRKSNSPEIDFSTFEDIDSKTLLSAINHEIQYFKNPRIEKKFYFGDLQYDKQEYLVGLLRFKDLVQEHLIKVRDTKKFYEAVQAEFDFFEAYGEPNWADVFITSYFEPITEGSRFKSEAHWQPIYKAPADMFELNLTRFDDKYKDDRKLRARLVGRSILPYFSREEIDIKKTLAGRGLELCWLDPVDAFFLQIQGSGTIQFKRGSAAQEMRVGYAEKNGQRYESIGKFLVGKIPAKYINMQGIEFFLKHLKKDILLKFLNQNPSYVFFKEIKERAITSLGVPATDGRTIATDTKWFPKGGLAFLMSSKPMELPELSEEDMTFLKTTAETIDPEFLLTPPEQLASQVSTQSGFFWNLLLKFGTAFNTSLTSLQKIFSSNKKREQPFSRFVFDQDTGGAITGPGRVDLFWGRGREAGLFAGMMKQKGKLYYLAPKRVN